MPENVVIINDDWLNDQLTDQQTSPKPSAGARMREAVATQNSSLWLKSFVAYETIQCTENSHIRLDKHIFTFMRTEQQPLSAVVVLM